MPDGAHPCKGKSVEAEMKLTRRATRPYHGRRWCDRHTPHIGGYGSLRNNLEGTNPKVTRLDVEASRTQNWWGKQISVEPGQIIQN